MRFQHSDNKIFINNTTVPYEWFLEQEPEYSVLPDNCIGRLYVPGKRHHLTMMKGDTPCQCEGVHDKHVWAEGDGYIAKEAEYAAAYNLFLNPPPTPEEQAELDATQYQRDRVVEYPNITDYLDGIVKGDDAQIQKYIDDCLAVKAKYPK